MIVAWKASGLPAQAFVDRASWSYNVSGTGNDGYAVDQLEPAASSVSSETFVQIQPPVNGLLGASATGMKVVLPNGLRLSLAPQAHLPWVTQILEALLRIGEPC